MPLCGRTYLSAATLFSYSTRRPPLFRQLFEAESSTYTYILADPDSESYIQTYLAASPMRLEC